MCIECLCKTMLKTDKDIYFWEPRWSEGRNKGAFTFQDLLNGVSWICVSYSKTIEKFKIKFILKIKHATYKIYTYTKPQ